MKLTPCFHDRHVACFFVLAMLISAATLDAAAQTVKFNSPATFPAGHPYVVSSGDFNGDGKIDLVAGDITTSDVLVLLGNGDGTLKAPLVSHVAAAPRFLVVSDFNRDGKLDLVYGDSPHISIMLGKGDGSFNSAQSYAVSGWHVLAADFNNDGKPDLVAGSTTSLIVLINNGDGTFKTPQISVVPQPIVRAFTTGDFNGDGKIDLFAYGRDKTLTPPAFISVFLGNGDGTFQSPINANGNWSQGSGPYSIVVGDFDRDQKLDVAVTDEFLIILKGNGDGTFKPPTSQAHLNNTSADLKIADFNGDGKFDLVTSGVFSTGALQVLMGNGDGTFQSLGDQINGSSSVSVVVADLNGDTRSDLAGNINGQLAVALVNVTPGNPDNTDYFVHQQYVDFLAREPDAGGFDFWANQISSCGANQPCIEMKRINTSGAFYLSIEFQQTAYLVERLYKVAYGDATGNSNTGGAHQMPVPVVRKNELLIDSEQINGGVVVLQPGWPAVLENNKQNFVSQFVQRGRFQTAFATSLSPADFVDRLNQNAGNVLNSGDRAALIGLFGNSPDTTNLNARAQVLRQIAENQDLANREINRAFVLMQYVGYLRRNPDDAPDGDYSGYDFWLAKLNDFHGNFIEAEMVKAFITSLEYRQRFQP
ncbi:MAG TPA: FG-GAP-like repeat-containing protein [Pyrinomonadaceae bacterium]|nr:FG-GAP-like repeat-containing protein [Pyrinomonadaceae bacterium]